LSNFPSLLFPIWFRLVRVREFKREYVQFNYLKVAFGFILMSYIASLISQLSGSLISGSLGWLGNYVEAAEFGVSIFSKNNRR
jgi:hypothetical protein